MKYTIRKSYKIEYAHRVYNQKKTITNPNTRCRNLHGHSGLVTVEITSTGLNEEGMVVDFTDLKPIKEYIDQFDHSLIMSIQDPKVNPEIVRVLNNSICVDRFFFEFNQSEGNIYINSDSCSSEIIAEYMFKDIQVMIKTIAIQLKNNNNLALQAIEFSETSNNMVRVEE